MKKFIITLVLLVSVFLAFGFIFLSLDRDLSQEIERAFFGISVPEETSLVETQTNQEENGFAKYYEDKDKGVYIAKITKANSIDYIDESTGPVSLKELKNTKEFEIGINSGYFTEDFNHAGLLYLNGNKVNDYAESNQLTEVLEITKESIDLVSIDNIDFSKKDTTYFQTGPSILIGSEVQNQKIENSLNGNSDSRRSFIGFDEIGNLYIGYTTKGFSLIKLGEYLQKNNIYDGLVTVINLDGGSSVSVYSKEHPEFGFGESKKLPYYILIN